MCVGGSVTPSPFPQHSAQAAVSVDSQPECQTAAERQASDTGSGGGKGPRRMTSAFLHGRLQVTVVSCANTNGKRKRSAELTEAEHFGDLVQPADSSQPSVFYLLQ